MLREEIAFMRDSVMLTEALKSKIACMEGSAKPRPPSLVGSAKSVRSESLGGDLPPVTAGIKVERIVFSRGCRFC